MPITLGPLVLGTAQAIDWVLPDGYTRATLRLFKLYSRIDG